MTRKEWLHYMLGFMVSKGWHISQRDAQDFKRAFPEVDEKYINPAVKK